LLNFSSMNHFFGTPAEAAKAAAQAVGLRLRDLIASQGRAVVLVDCISRPIDLFAHLIAEIGIDWTQVIVFQASEFVGEASDSRSSCQRFLTEHLISRVPIVTFHPMRANAPNQPAALTNISERLSRMPADVAILSTELFATLSAREDSTEQVVHLHLRERVALAFKLHAFEDASLFVVGEAAEYENRRTTPGNEQAFLFRSE
jgi:hypothetical protein